MTMPLADKLEIWGMESNTSIFSDGSLGFALKLKPVDVSCWDDGKLEAFDDQVCRFLNSLPSETDVQFVQDIKSDSKDFLRELELRENRTQDSLMKKITQSRFVKFKDLDDSGMLPVFEVIMFVRRKLQRPLINGGGFLMSEKKFVDIAQNALKEEIDKLNRIKNDLVLGLQNMGINSNELAQSEICSLMYDQWNPGRNLGLGAYNPEHLRPSILYSDAYPKEDGFYLGDTFHRLISLKVLPAQTFSSMIRLLQSLPMGARLFLTIRIPDQQKEVEGLQMQRRMAFSLVHGKQSGVSDIESGAKLEELEGLLTQMVAQGEKIFHFSLNILLRSKYPEELASKVSDCLSVIREMSGAEAMVESLPSFDLFCELAIPNARMRERSRRLKTSNLSHFIPLYAPWNGHENSRIVLRSRYGNVVKFDPFSSELTNANQIVSGGSGAGKSFLTNLLMIQMLPEKPQVYIVDIGGSYAKICQNLQGLYLSLGLNGQTTINPFDLPQGESRPSSEKIKFLVAMVELMAKEEGESGLKKLERSELEEAIQQLYDHSLSPRLSDLRAKLLHHQNLELVRIGRILHSWCGQSPYGKFLDCESNIKLDNRLICFDLKELEAYPDLQAVCLLLITDVVWREVQKDRTQMKFLIFDECWKLLENESGSQFIASVFRTFRKYFASCIAISQNIDDFAKSKVASAIMPNSSIKWILKQKGADKKRLQEVLDLNEGEVELINSLGQVKGRYSEAFLICEDKRSVVAIESTPYEYWLATTDPRDLKLQEQVRLEHQIDNDSLLDFLAQNHPIGASNDGCKS